MDRKPEPPPFPVGTKVRYTGKTKMWIHAKDGTEVPLKAPGMEVVIGATQPGWQGTLKPLTFNGDVEYYGEPTLDQTHDGYSIYYVEVPGESPVGRCIPREYAHEWEVVAPPAQGGD